MRVHFRHEGLTGRFAPEIETTAYRLIQEALTNAARHAGVSEVSVRVWLQESSLHLQVEDEGAGFVPEAALAANKTSGLAGMRERTRLLGGQLVIDSVPEKGPNSWRDYRWARDRGEHIMPISVFLADDHAVVRRGIRSILEAEADFIIVGEASDGLETVRLVERLAPDLLILDIMMPGLNGLDALRIIKQRVPQTRVMMLSMYNDLAFIAESLQCGALGYVLKADGINDIVTAARAAMDGRRYLSPPHSEQAVEKYLAKTGSAEKSVHELLTPRERQVFQLAAEGNTCSEIGHRLHLSERTIERHRAMMMHKLGLETQTDLVLCCRSDGGFYHEKTF